MSNSIRLAVEGLSAAEEGDKGASRRAERHLDEEKSEEEDARVQAEQYGLAYEEFQGMQGLHSLQQHQYREGSYKSESFQQFNQCSKFGQDGKHQDSNYRGGVPEHPQDYSWTPHSHSPLYAPGYRQERAPYGSSNAWPAETKKSNYRGVSWFKRGRKWRVAIKIAELGKNDIHIGFFTNEEDGARAYDVTLLGFFGRRLSSRHKTNFDMEEYTFDKIPILYGMDREEIRAELESWFGPPRFLIFRNGEMLFSNKRLQHFGPSSLQAGGNPDL
jgi:hypothetical protein